MTLNAAGFFEFAGQFWEDVPPVRYDMLTGPDVLEGLAGPDAEPEC